jgi:RNA polymerase sigma-70 factor, ECF subfamily
MPGVTATFVRAAARREEPLVALDFDAVYQAHAQQVARWVARLGGPGADVEDLSQEVFVVVARRLAEFRHESQLGTWLFSIAARIVANDRRRRRLRRWWFRLTPNLDDHPIAAGHTPSDDLDRAQDVRRFYEALDGLPERQRRAFLLFELDGLTVAAVAALMGLKEGNTRVLLHRARAAFVLRVGEARQAPLPRRNGRRS